MKEFRYLGRILTSTDDDWPAVARNLQKARATWGRLARILGREGADPQVSRNFYIAVTQQVLLFGAETWVLTRKTEAFLDAFQGMVARRLTGRMPRRGRDGKWVYLPLAGATKETETSGSGVEKGTGEEASLGASGSSGAEWSGAED